MHIFHNERIIIYSTQEITFMKDKKFYIALNDREYAEIISFLINKRNSLIRYGKYADDVDEVIKEVKKAKKRSFRVHYI